MSGEINWQEQPSARDSTHPELVAYGPVLRRLGAARRDRARQLFYFCVLNKISVTNARDFEQEFDRCVRVFGEGS